MLLMIVIVSILCLFGSPSELCAFIFDEIRCLQDACAFTDSPVGSSSDAAARPAALRTDGATESFAFSCAPTPRDCRHGVRTLVGEGFDHVRPPTGLAVEVLIM